MMKHKQPNEQSGINIFELLLMVVILSVIAALAVPSYMDFLKRSAFSSTADLAEVLKINVENCIKKQKNVQGCTSGQHGIPVAVMPTDDLPGAKVFNGVITMVAPLGKEAGASGKTYILTPEYQGNNQLQWHSSGSACYSGYVACQ